MDYLCECTNDRERREALTKLPPDIPSSYERILERVNNSKNSSNQQLVIRTLQWTLFARERLTTDQYLEALSVYEGDTDLDSSAMTDEEEILNWCSSLIRKRRYSGFISRTLHSRGISPHNRPSKEATILSVCDDG